MNPWQTSTAEYFIDDLLDAVTDASNQTNSFEYNNLRYMWKSTDALNRTSTRVYDEVGRLKTLTDNSGTVQVSNTYTNNGLLKSVTDGTSNKTDYEYDGFDRAKKTTYPNGKSEELTFDSNGQITNIKTRNGENIGLTYDSIGRLTQKTVTGMPTVSYVYDLAGRKTQVSTPVVAGNPASGDFDYYYDTAGRLIKEEWPDNKSVQYQYDANDNVTRLTYPDAYYIERVYDEINRLTGIKLNGSSVEALDFDYNKLSQRTKLTYANGVATTYGYEIDSDLNSLIQSFTGSSVTITNAFNSAHELTSKQIDDSSYMWHPASAGTVSYGSANNMNQYPTVGGTTYLYNNNGCLTDDGNFEYTYDALNQLIEADDGSTVSTYIYDPMRRQNQKDVGGTKTRFVYDGLRMIAEYDGSGNIQNKYIYGVGIDEILIQVDSSNNAVYLHHDDNGSIIATSDSTGAVVNKYAYSPFGQSNSLTGTDFGYTGQRFDSETGLYYFKYRHYSPELGRFLQPDLIGYVDGLNLYQYAYNDPNTNSDPLGLAVTNGNFAFYNPDLITQRLTVADIQMIGTLLSKGLTLADWQAHLWREHRDWSINASNRLTEYWAEQAQGFWNFWVVGTIDNFNRGATGPTYDGLLALFDVGLTLATLGAAGSGMKLIFRKSVVTDTNFIVAVVEMESSAAVKQLGGRIPLVPRQVVREFLVKGDIEALRQFLRTYGGRVAASGTEKEVIAAQELAIALERSLKLGDARIFSSALKEKAPILTNDGRFTRFLKDVGFPVEGF